MSKELNSRNKYYKYIFFYLILLILIVVGTLKTLGYLVNENIDSVIEEIENYDEELETYNVVDISFENGVNFLKIEDNVLVYTDEETFVIDRSYIKFYKSDNDETTLRKLFPEELIADQPEYDAFDDYYPYELILGKKDTQEISKMYAEKYGKTFKLEKLNKE